MLSQKAKDEIMDAWAIGVTLAQRAIRCSGKNADLSPKDLERLLQSTFAMAMTFALSTTNPEVRACSPEQLWDYIQGIYLTECGDSSKVFFHTDEA